MQILNLTRNSIIASRTVIADTFFLRMAGLLNRRSLPPGEALVITRCQSIHMIFMRFAIDVIFVSKANGVVGLAENIKPYQFSKIFFSSSLAIECPVGTIQGSQTSLGDQISIQ